MIQLLDPCLDVDWQSCIQVSQCVPDGWPQLLRIPARTHHHPCLTRWRLQEWEKHSRLWILSEAVLSSLFRNAAHLDARSILYAVIAAQCARSAARELRT